MEKVKIGLVGLGWMGSWHGQNVLANPNAELTGICDSSNENMKKFVADTGTDRKMFSDYSEMLKSDIDAVIIAGPNATHAEMCIQAAVAGKHIYCEKPMAITVDDCKRVREAVEKAGVKFLIGYHRRLNPLYQYTKQLLDEGKLGKPFMVESDYLHYVPGDLDIWSWLGKESIAGSLFHAGSGHNIDLIRYFCGDITEISCMKDILLPRREQVEREDTAIAICRFENDAIGKVQFCVGPVMPFQFNFKLYGTSGSVINNKVWLDSIPDFAEAGHEDDCIELPKSWIPDNVQGNTSETWSKLMDHFIDMISNNIKSINDIESAYKTSIVCFAAMKSAKEGKTVSIKEME